MDYEKVEAIVRIQKAIRGFVERKRLIASNEKYAKINFRKINHKGISAVGLMDINTILVDFTKGIQCKQAPSPMDSILSDLSGLNRQHNELKNLDNFFHTEMCLHLKPLVSISSIESYTKAHALLKKPFISFAEIIEKQENQPLHQNSLDGCNRIDKKYTKPEKLIETHFPRNQKESSIYKAQDPKNLEQEFITMEKKTETISHQLLKKPICVIFIIRKLPSLKNIDLKPKSKAKINKPYPPVNYSPKNLGPSNPGLKQSLSSGTLYKSSHQDALKPTPYASRPLERPLKPSACAPEIKKHTLPALPVSSRVISTASKDIIVRSQKNPKPTSLAKDIPGQTYNTSSPYDGKWIDQYLIDYFKVPRPQESLKRKQILKEKIQDLYKPKRF